jgi:hypothetical protein
METPPPAPRPQYYEISYPDCLDDNYKRKLDQVLPKLNYLSSILSPDRNVLGGSITIVLHILATNLPDKIKCEFIKLVVNPDPEKNTNVDFYIGNANNAQYLNLLKKFNSLKMSDRSGRKMNSVRFNFNGNGNMITVDLFATQHNNGKFHRNDVTELMLNGNVFRLLNIKKLLAIYSNLEGKRVSEIKKQYDQQKISVLKKLLNYMKYQKRKVNIPNGNTNGNTNGPPVRKKLFGGGYNLYLNVGKFGKRKIRMQKNKKLYIILNGKKYKLPF